jgi:hypothetical protein
MHIYIYIIYIYKMEKGKKISKFPLFYKRTSQIGLGTLRRPYFQSHLALLGI